MEKNGVRETVTLNATARACFDTVVNYESYPQWLPEFTSARVVKRESETVEHIEFTIGVTILLKKIETKYTIRAEKWPEELRTHWTYVAGDVIDDTEGSWTFTEIGGKCRVDYEAMISINVPVSKGIANKVANSISSKTLPRTFRALEKQASKS